MKVKTFENLIRKIVREEIDYSLRREIKSLKEDLRDELKPQIIEEVIISPKNIKSSLKEKIMGNPPTKQLTPSTTEFTKNNALNDLLNETARGDTNTETANAPVSLAQPFASGAPMPEDTTGMPTDVASALTRDYSGLMKAIEKKKGN